MINNTMDLFEIDCCDLALIWDCISWDQNGMLYTREWGIKTCSLDKYRFFTGKIMFYPQTDRSNSAQLDLV